MKTYINKSKLDKKLCIHCKHCNVYSGCGLKDRIMCDLYKDKVSGSELYSAFSNRYNIFKCGGFKWEISPDILVCETEKEAIELNYESQIESYMDYARKILKGDIKKGPITCGFLEKALEKASKELNYE